MSKKFEAYVSNGLEILANRKNQESSNVLKMKENFGKHAKLLFSVNFNLNTLNDDVHKFNTKVISFSQFLNGETFKLNAYVRAFFLTAHKLTQANSHFSSVDMKKACDSNFKVKDERDNLIVTIPKDHTTGTVGAQSSQCRSMLRDFGIFKEVADECYVIDYENKHAKRMIELLQLA